MKVSEVFMMSITHDRLELAKRFIKFVEFFPAYGLAMAEPVLAHRL
jgi:hypothetical protein